MEKGRYTPNIPDIPLPDSKKMKTWEILLKLIVI